MNGSLSGAHDRELEQEVARLSQFLAHMHQRQVRLFVQRQLRIRGDAAAATLTGSQRLSPGNPPAFRPADHAATIGPIATNQGTFRY